MTYPVVSDVVSGQALTSAWAEEVKAADDFKRRQPTALYYNAAGQAIPNDTWTVISLDTGYYDVDDNNLVVWAASNPSRLTFNYSGVYRITGGILWPTNATGERGIGFRYNANGSWTTGSAINAPLVRTAMTGWNTFQQLTSNLNVNAGSYVQMFGYQKSTVSLTTVASSVVNSTYLAIDLLSLP